MDPLTGYVAIVSLLHIFKQERRASSDDSDRDAFLRWLDEHAFQDLIDHAQGCQQLMDGLELALREDHQTIMAKLDSLSEVMACLLGRVQGLGEVARYLLPNAGLSDQAISILRQLVTSGVKEIIRIEYVQGAALEFNTRAAPALDVDDNRFVDDDLQSLVDLGLLLPRASRDARFYGVTRAAVALIEAVDQQR